MTDNTTKSQHTPGPWKVVPTGERFLSVRNELGQEATFVSKSDWDGYEEKDGWKRDRYTDRPQAEADARLIAAAPDLLVALEEMLGTFGGAAPGDDEAHAVLGRAIVAISKATGAK